MPRRAASAACRGRRVRAAAQVGVLPAVGAPPLSGRPHHAPAHLGAGSLVRGASPLTRVRSVRYRAWVSGGSCEWSGLRLGLVCVPLAGTEGCSEASARGGIELEALRVVLVDFLPGLV